MATRLVALDTRSLPTPAFHWQTAVGKEQMTTRAPEHLQPPWTMHDGNTVGDVGARSLPTPAIHWQTAMGKERMTTGPPERGHVYYSR